jgi:hypothetical protein
MVDDEGGPTDMNLMYINAQFSPDKYETELLLDCAAAGGDIFISTDNLEGPLADTLGVSTVYSFNMPLGKKNEEDSVPVNIDTTQAPYMVKQSLIETYLNLDSATGYDILGQYYSHPNFVRFSLGEGHIYISSAPKLFSNIVVADPEDWKYACDALSYLPVRRTIWDEHYKGYGPQRSELSYIISQAPLRWAYYLLVIGLLTYILFEGKRRQRVIPVLEPLQNTTLEFVETVGRLYYQNRDNADLAAKKIAHFYDFLHHRLHIRYREDDKMLIPVLSRKSGMPEEKIEEIFSLIRRVSISPGEQTVIELSKKIDEFYKQF